MRRIAMRPVIFLCIGLLHGMAAHAAECSISSGPQRTALLELYTSEGCSSCPPADRWLSRVGRTRNVVPLAWHVDYWDYLGWRDRFSRPDFSARQREMAQLNGSSFVYTPQVMLNGRDFRKWTKTGSLAQAVADTQPLPSAATIQLSVHQGSRDTLEVTLRAQAFQAGPNVIYIALYQNGLSTRVERGENAGSLLRHDYVVREWHGPFRLLAQGETTWKQEISHRRELTQAYGVAAFVQNTATSEVLQAVARPLCTD
jgi:hypothetical protein